MVSHSIEDWFQLYEKDITSFLIYYTGSMDVEDLVQDTFMIAMKKMPKFKGDSHPKTWLITIARNRVIDNYRRGKVWGRMKHLFFRDQILSNELEEQTIINEDIAHLYKAIYLLPSRYKEVIIVRGILELTPREASQVLKRNENHINVMYHRSLKKLRVLLEEDGFTYEEIEGFTRESKKPS